MLVRSKQKQDCPLYNCLNGTTYNIQNISALTANQGTNTLAFSYVELTLKGCCGKTNFDAAPYDVGVLIDLMNTLLRVQR